tara:strand:- start:1095 stop:2030 length:936 start_codon:yes stop_codon:yes gene_type:complete
MAAFGTYYIDAPTLEGATAVYTDAALTVCATDGVYSDGIIYRQQTSCSLGAPLTCPSCVGACTTPIAGTGTQGVYNVAFNVGTGTGAVIITFTPTGAAVPSALQATFDGAIYNAFSTANFGYKAGTAGLPTFVGDAAADCGIVAGSPYTLTEYSYSGGVFSATGSTVVKTVVAGQMQMTVGVPGACVMVVPKTSLTANLDIEITSPCGTPPAWSIAATCPTALTGFSSTTDVSATSVAACALATPTTYYNAPVTGTAGNPNLYDWIFTDVNGQFPLASFKGAGYYHWDDGSAAGRWIQIDSNSVVISTGAC